MDLDGDPYVNFPDVPEGAYRVALRHRNHLGVMSGSSQQLGRIPQQTNFRSGVAYGTNPLAPLYFSVFGLWPGDVTFDGVVRYTGNNNDRDPILVAIGGNTPTNTVSNVYSSLDVNMDGVIKYTGANNDRDPILTTVGGSTPTNTRTQQLP